MWVKRNCCTMGDVRYVGSCPSKVPIYDLPKELVPTKPIVWSVKFAESGNEELQTSLSHLGP